MDLFGDLPSLQNKQAISSSNSGSSNNARDKKINPLTDNNAVKTATKKTPPTNECISNNSSQILTPCFSRSNTHKSIGTSATASSILSGLGNAGTTMAFVPSALRKRKTIPQSETVTTSIAATNTSIAPVKKLSESLKIYPSDSNVEIITITAKSSTTRIHEIEEQYFKQEDRQQQTQEESIPEEEILDPYNPLQPNDYLLYRQQKKQERQNKEIKQRTEETLKLQQAVRKRIEEEREQADASGDVDRMVQLREKQQGGISGRGRGRGVSNLPAWILKQKKGHD